jgi:uncharacterized protein CbrC (UPF0167 family)
MAFSAAWQMVTCSNCGKHYQCTPSSDYYNATTLEDGVCEFCLLDAAGLADKPVVEVQPIVPGRKAA